MWCLCVVGDAIFDFLLAIYFWVITVVTDYSSNGRASYGLLLLYNGLAINE
jgi:hypothetical protein